MSPTQFNNGHHQNHNHQHAKREQQQQQLIHGGACPVPLKINKDSHLIKKTSPSSSSSSTSSLAAMAATAATPPPKPQQHRHPVIIYTHSPKVIHTHPRDFMALVQKLTGFSRSDGDDEDAHRTAKSAVKTGKNEISEGGENNNNNNNNNKNKRGGTKGSFGTEDNESSSAITTEDNCGDHGQVNSCLLPPPYFDPPPNPYLTTNIPLFAPNSSAEFLCSNPPLFNYTHDSLFFNPPNMRNSSSTLEAMNEFRDY